MDGRFQRLLGVPLCAITGTPSSGPQKLTIRVRPSAVLKSYEAGKDTASR
jgi:hypothetical protein